VNRVSNRLAQLEAAAFPADLPEPLHGLPLDFLDREARRWGALLEGPLDDLDDEKARRLAQAASGAKFGLLRWLVEVPDFEDEARRHGGGWSLQDRRKNWEWNVRRWLLPTRRWPRALATFIDRLPPAMRGPVLVAGLAEIDLDRVHPGKQRFPDDSWLGCWLYSLCELDSRIPPDLDPAAFGLVLDVMLARRAEVDRFDHYGTTYACPATGLWVPRPKQKTWRVIPGKVPCEGPGPWYFGDEFFETCPGCGAGRWEKYGGLVCQSAAEKPARTRPWPEWARAELDPEN
jgi:hypothetical protein